VPFNVVVSQPFDQGSQNIKTASVCVLKLIWC